MLITFFDSIGMIHREFVPPGQTVNVDFCLAVMKRLVPRIARVCPQYREQGSWWFLHDNAPTQIFCSVQVIDHASYSPDLAACDYFSFPKLKLLLKGNFFNDILSIQKNVTGVLSEISSDEYKKCFERFVDRLNACIASEGMYFG